jgi:hypothetical protein
MASAGALRPVISSTDPNKKKPLLSPVKVHGQQLIDRRASLPRLTLSQKKSCFHRLSMILRPNSSPLVFATKPQLHTITKLFCAASLLTFHMSNSPATFFVIVF